MSRRFNPEQDWDTLREQVIGLGKQSLRKNHYSLLRDHVQELERFRELLDFSDELILIVELPGGRIVDANGGASRALGYSPEEFLELTLATPWPAFSAMEAQRLLDKAPLAHDAEAAFKDKSGRLFPVEGSIKQLVADGKTLLTIVARDITERKQAAEIIWRQANFDALTDLPNRRMFHDRLAQEIKKADRSKQQLALLFIDLDNFKEVNDALGHPVGDALLIKAARRVTESVRATDTVARLGGDEFTVMLPNLDEPGCVERIVHALLQTLSQPFTLGDEVVTVSASIGITVYPDDATEIDELLKCADQSMYVAKKAGRNRFSYFTPALQEAAQKRLRLINDLRNAVAENQLRVFFQPIVDSATGRIHKAEALVRWQHPQRGMVSPAEFIPLAEETGLIFEIGDWVFKESVRWALEWRQSYCDDFQISVNKSPIQFYKDSAYDGWLAHMDEVGLVGDGIVIEITESLLLDSASPIMDSFLAYRDRGIQVAIDDFGTGYSSLSYLKKFDIDFLKIDQSFTRNLAPGSSDMALSEAIIVMAHKLGLKVIAEGVETEAQRDLLVAAGCDYAQGYLFSRPVPAVAFSKLLRF
jgi:diguanylate cyclase (GGDEF)-like protein/PAS domain S-box-containing protein